MKTVGKLYIISAASGTGKTSLVKKLVDGLDNIAVSISHTTRPIRSDEKNEINYFFVSEQQFEAMIANNEFIEYAKVFGNYYGTSRHWVEEQINKGISVILEIDWQGALQVKKIFPESIGIFILPPSMDELKRRLKKRNQDNSETVKRRLLAASKEISHYMDFDYIVINDKFNNAIMDLKAIIRSCDLVKDVQAVKYKELLLKLTKHPHLGEGLL